MSLSPQYQRKRRELATKAEDLAVKAWMDREFSDREGYIKNVLLVVSGAQRQTAELVAAYFTLKVRERNPNFKTLALPKDEFTVSSLRGQPANEVYDRPFGALGARLAAGDDFARANKAGADYVRKLAAVDVQLAQTHSSKAWINTYNETGGERIKGYQRVLGGGDCDYCVEAATMLYSTDDLMPIHENCKCGVEPVFGDDNRPFHESPGLADDELGSRLDQS